MEQVYVVGVDMAKFGRHRERSLDSLIGETVSYSLDDAGCLYENLGAVFYSGTTQGHLQGQTFIPGQTYLGKRGYKGVPVFNIENGCAAGSSAFYLAVKHVQSGTCDIAMAVGAEKMNIEDKKRMFSVFDGGWDVEGVDENLQRLVSLGEGVDVPEGSESERPYSVFMKVYAAFCRNHMKKYGTTQRQIAAVSAKNHQHSVHNPYAQFQKPYTIEEILESPPITYPLTLPMCAPVTDGAASVIVCNEQGLEELKVDRKSAIKVLASVARSGDPDRSDSDPDKHCAHLAAVEAYNQSGVSPADVHLAEVHDATAMGEIIHAENLMLAPFGEGGVAAEAGDFTIGGRVPVNPSGGLESKGHPIGATGLAQIFELVTQLRGEAGKRQVEDARIAIQENSGGLTGIEEAAVIVNIFSVNEA